ncbi:MAG: 4-alpha-glucanotransferase [Candidatus Dormibacteraeota bacterium]|nr:4-alpha-glucanotransferase [Candidatus Dormibacteraeota bacterium]
MIEASAGTVAAALSALGARDAGEPPPSGALILHHGDSVDHPIEVETEGGRSLRIEGRVGGDVPLGYHRIDGALPGTLIISPRRCHLPAGLRLGGWAVQLYAARSESSWGIGDLGDLREFGGWAAAAGDGFALLSPLNAAATTPPIEASPYLPTSRRWRNPLFLRIEDVPGAEVLGADLERIARAGHALNAERTVDRDAVAIVKLDALTRISEASPPRTDFRRWRRAQGQSLERFATFAVLAEQHGGDFHQWPEKLRDPSSPAVRGEARRSHARVTFHAWLQWLIEGQLAGAAAALPLMTDLPIGVDPGGADVWADGDLFATDFSVGAPPDLFNTIGQDWAQPPWNPWRLRARGYDALIAVLRAGFAHAMGLRIDHVMGLFRLYWIPRGGSPTDGVFVRYPADDILDILALESVRAGALVVGEDLGTVEPVVREQMAARDILSYRLLWFEEGEPSTFPERAMSAVTTHDLPTVAGLWRGDDVEAQRSIGVPVNEPGIAEIRERLARVAGGRDEPAAVIETAYAALAASPSMLVVASLEDAAEVVERPNMPGTTAERWPNWRLALPQPLEDLLASPLARRLAEILRRT